VTPALYINSAGMVEAVDPARAPEVEGLGWVPASVEQSRDYFLAQKYGTTGQAAVAGLESFGSMLSLGASTWAETAAGVPAEDIAAREKHNPLASGAGATAGILLPLLLSGGESAAAQGETAASRAASMAGPSLLAKAGKAVSRAVLPELPEGAPLAQRLAAKGLAAAAGGALEGAGYEAGQLVHESALGDPNRVAESALARIGLSAATFGALSGGGGILGELAGEALSSIKGGGAGAKLADWLGDFEAERNIKAAGGIQSDLTRARKQIGREGLNSIGREMGELGLVGPFSTPAQTLERADALMGRSGATMGDVLKSADDLAAAEGKTIGGGYSSLARARTEILTRLEEDPMQRQAAALFKADLDAWEPKFANGATLVDLHKMRRSVDTALYGWRGSLDPFASAYREALHDFRNIISDNIETGILKSKLPLPTEAVATWKTANREYQVAARAAEFAEKGLDRSTGNNPFGLSAILGGVAGTVAGGPIGGLAATAATELTRRYSSGVLGGLARGLRGLLEGEEGALVANRTAEAVAAERLAGGAGVAARASTAPETAAALSVLAKAQREVTQEIDGALSHLLRSAPQAVGRTAAATASRAAAQAVEARQLANSPELLQDALTRQTDELHGHAPDVSQAAQMAAARAVAFLASKAPATALRGLHAKGTRPSAFELGKFGRYADVVERPLRALQHARRGTLTPEHVGALRIVYPALHRQIQSRLMDQLMGHGGKTISPQSRMMLSMLTGYPLDGSLGWNAIAANQAVYARPAQQPMDGPVGSPNAVALKQAGRVQTAGQRRESRLGGES